jgi:hypothetical protein
LIRAPAGARIGAMRLFRRIKDPVEGTAQVVSSTVHSGGRWSNVEMTLVVQAPGAEPFTLRHGCMAPADRWPHPGTVLPVVFDREHTDRLDVQWDDMPTGEERAQAQADALRDSLAGGGGAFGHVHTQVIDLSGRREAPGAEDRLTALERLARLRDGGALTDAEFEAEKRRLLG